MSSRVSIGATILRLALAFFLIVTGVWGIMGASSLFTGITALFAGSLRTIIVFVIAIAAFIAGILLLVEMFGTDILAVDVILLVFTILWAVQLVLTIVGSLSSAFANINTVLAFLYKLSYDLLVLAALIICQKRFN